ncbi:XopAF/AvrXv3 family type III secretion system effector [Herbaspirillum huttiense]|uniref:XopAF/AvrXv3 family type III secretion system effector n=1 Tax=Herbaspirillum huttiense TaxID=863372 RepID=UPI002176BF26|nr:XopAF/AvrXv3 family type III secretion system effector [Herbaspirillum huttiense]UWE19022.1 hypothetical protein NY669_12830 [Herbaspirillum huttiense]
MIYFSPIADDICSLFKTELQSIFNGVFMTSSITRYFYNPAEYPPLQQATSAQNQALRSHPNAAPKDRSNETAFPARLASSRIVRSGGSVLQRQFLLNRSIEIKGVGYNTSTGSPATTGTSKTGVLCMTDGLDLCFAVAIGGEKTSGEPAAKVRVFHVMPANENAQRDIRIYAQQLKREGYSVRAAIHGGDSSSASSNRRLGAVDATLEGLEVPIDFHETGAGGEGNGALGAVIEAGGRIRFVTQLVK